MSVFGQVWVYSLAAFVLGVLLTWLVLVRPVRARVRELERRVVAHRSEFVTAAQETPPRQQVWASDTADADAAFAELDADLPTAEESGSAPLPDWAAGADLGEPSVYGDDAAVFTDSDLTDSMPGPHAEWFASVDEQTRTTAAPGQDAGATVGAPGISAALAPDESSVPALAPAPPSEVSEEQSRGLFQPALPSTDQGFERTEKSFPSEPVAAPSGDRPSGDRPSGDRPGDDAERATTGSLPKRQPRDSPAGGFDPPEPIQPSMRMMTRREPTKPAQHSGSLFEPGDAAGLAAEHAETVETGSGSDAEDGPVGPFGQGSAMPLPGGGKPSEGFTVKASVTTLRYCSPASGSFPEMVAEVWFRTAQDAERVGFRPID